MMLGRGALAEGAPLPAKSPGPMKQILLILAAVVTAVLLTEFLFTFYEWNREQTCATAGGRNCAGPPMRIQR
jgi:hypothetical protein